MTSNKQAIANKANAQKAGVKTDAGKAKIRFNAFKHGLTSKALIAHVSDLDETMDFYLEVLQGLRESFIPRNFFEEQQVDLMARALIKLRRCDIWEAQHFKEEMKIIGDAVYLYVHPMENALRYRQAIENQYYRAMLTLQQARGPRQLDLFCTGGNHGD